MYFSIFMSRRLPILANLLMHYAKERRSMILFLLPVWVRASGEFGIMAVQYGKKFMNQWTLHMTSL